MVLVIFLPLASCSPHPRSPSHAAPAAAAAGACCCPVLFAAKCAPSVIDADVDVALAVAAAAAVVAVAAVVVVVVKLPLVTWQQFSFPHTRPHPHSHPQFKPPPHGHPHTLKWVQVPAQVALLHAANGNQRRAPSRRAKWIEKLHQLSPQVPPPSTLGTRPSSVAVKGRRLWCRAAFRPKDVGLLELW